LKNSDLSKIQDIARNMNPSFEVYIEKVKDLIIIYVPEGKNKPYTVNGHFYMRYGANSQQLNRDEIRILFQKENLLSFEKQIKEFNEKDFSLLIFNKFKKQADLDKKLSKKHILTNLNLLSNDKLNNAGILFFAKNIKNYFQTSSVACFLYADNEQIDIIDSKEFSEDFISNLENANKYVISKLNTAIIIKDSLRHKAKLELPKEALREAIINAMIHKDYFIPSDVQIHITPDKVEIVNPGKLLFPKKEFGKVSARRNPILVDLIYRLGFVEKAGSGIKRIKRLMREYDFKIKFETGDFFRIIFYRKNKEHISEWGANVDAKTDERQKWILTYLKTNGKIKSLLIQKYYSISKELASRDIKILIQKNKIRRKGAGNNIWYELKVKSLY